MRTKQELIQMKKQIKEYTQVIENPTYYYGVLSALNWAIGDRDILITEQDKDRLNKTYEQALKRVF